MIGYNFTERTKQVLALAREEASALSHEYVGTEHILLGILRGGPSLAIAALQNRGVAPDNLRARILGVLKAGKKRAMTEANLPYTSRAVTVIEESMAAAREIEHTYVGPEHLLLGLLREKRGIAAETLTSEGVTVENARAEILQILRTAFPAPSGAEASDVATTISTPLRSPQFAERLRSVISAAHDVAARHNSTQVTAVHAMIALLEHGQGMANAALDSIALKRADALSALRQLAPAGTDPIGPEDVLNWSEDLAHVLRALSAPTQSGFVFGTHHLLLLLLQSSPEVAAVFKAQNVPYHAVRDAVTRMSG